MQSLILSVQAVIIIMSVTKRRITMLMSARQTGHRTARSAILIAQLLQKSERPHATNVKPSRAATRQSSEAAQRTCRC